MAMFEIPCGHVCHTRGLNPWIEECPTCGCENPEYDPNAVSDVDPLERVSLAESIAALYTLRRRAQPTEQHEEE